MNYLKGITFNNQSFNPKNDGRIYEKIYGDCILSGCALTYSGTDIYMAVGDMIVGGRLINVDSAVTIATSATYANGYGRLKISVDLTRTSTTETNQQAAVEIEYAATNAFADLTQGDVNGSDTLYEAELAIVQFESGNVAAVTKTINVAELAINYVTEEGVSGSWTYKKWHDGTMELWLKQAGSVNFSGSGPIYVGNPFASDINYPYEFADSPFIISAAGGNGSWGGAIPMVYTADKTKLKTSVITMFSMTAFTDAAFVYFAYIVGKVS